MLNNRAMTSLLLVFCLMMFLLAGMPSALAADLETTSANAAFDTTDDQCQVVDMTPDTMQPMSTTPGSAACLVAKAHEQVGNTYADYGFPSSGWCGKFISWCARNANISGAIIPQGNSSLGPEVYQPFFASRNRYYTVDEVGVTYNIQAGDICFTSGTSGSAIVHVSIVYSANATKVFTIDGSLEGSVKYMSYELSDNVVGFARPAYGGVGHSWNVWNFNAYNHWRHCANCNAFSSGTHTATNTGACSVCRYDPNISVNKQPGFVAGTQKSWKPEE